MKEKQDSTRTRSMGVLKKDQWKSRDWIIRYILISDKLVIVGRIREVRDEKKNSK